MDFGKLFGAIADLVAGGGVSRAPVPPTAAEEMVFTDCGPAIDSQDVQEMEQALQLQVPAEYRAFLLRTNGGVPARTVFDFTNVKDKKLSRTVDRFFAVNHPDPALESRQVYETFCLSQRVTPLVIPAARDSNGGLICVSIAYDRPGTLWYWDPTKEDKFDPEENMALLAGSLAEFLGNLHQ